MGAFDSDAFNVRAPISSRVSKLAGTGSTQQDLGSDLRRTARVVVVADVPVFLDFAGSGATPTVTSSSLRWPADVPLAFTVDDDSRRISAEAADGASAFRVDIWEASPGPY